MTGPGGTPVESSQPPHDAATRFLKRHQRLSRRHFMAQSGGSAAALMLAGETSPEALKPLLEKLGPYLTPQDSFRDVSRGKPVPHSLPPERLREAGLTRDTWRLEILPDPEHPAALGKRFSVADGTAITFDNLVEIAKTKSVRFPKLMTCLNIGCPLGMGVWEGVPLRELVWMARPRENLRRVHYHGYHNNDPAQMFRSSLPVGRVLEDPDGLPPVIVCHKLNGEWLTPERGAPARMVVPEHYGFKSVKWLTRVFLSNLPYANDTYAGQNNDIDSPMKTFAATLHVTEKPVAGKPIGVTGYAQSGVSGLSKVQVWISPAKAAWKADDPWFATAPWTDAAILGPPESWLGGAVRAIRGLDARGTPARWPMRLAMAHWAVLLPGLPAGDYTLRSRTIDEGGNAQPMPRPFRKGGRCDIEEIAVRVS